MARIEELKKLSMLDVAAALGMELKRQGSDRYAWIEHESLVINTRMNRFSWFSRDFMKGDVLNLVQLIREEQTGHRPSFKEAKHFLEAGKFPEAAELSQAPKIAFEYKLEQYEHVNTSFARNYLTRERKLSAETVNFFFDQGSIPGLFFKRTSQSESRSAN